MKLTPALLLLFVSLAVAQSAPPSKVPSDQQAKPEPSQRQRASTAVGNFDLAPQQKVVKAAGAGGAGSASPLLLAPHLGKLYGPTPRFSWRFNRRVSKFVFLLADEKGEEIYRTQVTRPEFQYPSDAPPLEPGKTYYWRVEPSPKGADAMSSERAGLKVISGPELHEIEQALSKIGPAETYENGLARARLFAEHGLWYDALSAYGELMEKNPDRAELYQERSAIYAQLEPTKDLAERDAARAREIKK